MLTVVHDADEANDSTGGYIHPPEASMVAPVT